MLGVLSMLFGACILTINVAGEYLALGVPLRELPSVQMMLWRVGLAAPGSYELHAVRLGWPGFIKEQLYRVGRMSIPHILIRDASVSDLLRVLGAGVLIANVAAAVRSRHRVLILSLVLSGLFWALPMRHFVAFHDFQSVFYIGMPLVLYSGLALRADRASRTLGVAVAAVASLLFVSSAVQLKTGEASSAGDEQRVLVSDFQRIADQVGTARTVFVDGDFNTIGGAWHAVSFYLAGNYFQGSAKNAEFIVTNTPDGDGTLLTPVNERVFLYRSRPR